MLFDLQFMKYTPPTSFTNTQLIVGPHYNCHRNCVSEIVGPK